MRYLIITLFTILVSTHSIVSTDYIEECDNAICEYTNKIILLIHPYDYNRMVIGYDNMTNSNIYFDLNSAYFLYDVNATKNSLYFYEYEYYYNCWNEIMNIPYSYTCNTTKIGDCKYYSNEFPFPTGDCMGLQKRYFEISKFRPSGETATCVTKKSIQARLSGSITINNDTTIFDTELEIGRLSTINNEMKLSLISGIAKRGMVDVCKLNGVTNARIVLDLLQGMDIEDFISRRVVNGHLITNFQESLLPYEIDNDLIVNQKGIFSINETKYFFLYYMGVGINNTALCKPIPYADGYESGGTNTISINAKAYDIYIDRNCTKPPNPLPTSSPSRSICNNGFTDDEGNIFCYVDGYLRLLTGKVVSQEIQDEFMIQISYKGNYKAKQVFYDRCRVREITYINNTINIYDCEDYVFIKNKYTNRVYKVKNGMQITLPDGIYYLADYISSPLLYVINSIETPTMYYAKDKFYSKIVIGLGFSIDIIEKKSSYISFYVVISVLVIVILAMLVLIVKHRNKCKRNDYQQLEEGNSMPKKKKSIKQRINSKMPGRT